MAVSTEDMANVPPQVRAEAEALEAQVKADMEKANAAPVEEPAPEPAPPAAPVVEDAPKPEQKTVEPALSEMGTQTPERKPVLTLNQAEQALRVLQGKYDHEVTQVHAQNRDLRDQVQALQAQLEAKPAAAPAPEPATDPTDPENPYGLTEDEQDLGPEVLAVSQKIGKKIAEETVARMMEPIKAKLQAQEAEQHQSTLSAFKADLTARVPNWETVNEQSEFVEWLQGVQPGTRRTRKSLLNEAAQARDSGTAAWYFEQFLSETGQGGATTARRVQEQVVPRRGAATPAPAQKVWTMDEWQKANIQLTTMRDGLRKEELDKELKAAVSEGRVR